MRLADAADRFRRQIAIHPAQAHQHDQAVQLLRHQRRIRQPQGRWRVVDHQVVVIRCGKRLHQLGHALGTQQPGRVRRPPAGGDHIPAAVVGHRLNAAAPVAGLIGEQVAQAAEVVQADAVVQLGLAQVGIHQQHPLAQLAQGFGQQHRHQALALRRH